jgi:hypothetical protein
LSVESSVSEPPDFIPKAALRRRDRPRMLVIAPPLLLLGTLCGLAWLVVASLAAGEGSVYSFVSPLSPSECWFRVLPMLLLLLSQQVLLAFAFWRQKRWARPLAAWLPLSWVVLPVFILPAHVPRAAIVGDGAGALLVFALTIWYFYRRESVRAYFARLDSRREVSQ